MDKQVMDCYCDNLIKQLNVSSEIKNVLSRINCVASSSNLKMRQSVKDLFIVSPACKELSKIARCYERIITVNSVYPTRGTNTYLELAFPNSEDEKDYKMFFASPKLAAVTQNDFAGVFLISFEQWKNVNELLKSPAYDDLKKYIEKNKWSMSFVFHTTPEFGDSRCLYNELQGVLNICYLEHQYPDLETAVNYIEDNLNKAGIKLDISGKEEIRKKFKEKIDFSNVSYRGYETLEVIASRLSFELYTYMFSKNRVNENDYVMKNEICEVSECIKMPCTCSAHMRKLGF